MGYDLSFVRMPGFESKTFPIACEELREKDLFVRDDAEEIRKMDRLLSEFPGVQRHDPDGWWWESPNQGSIRCWAIGGDIFVDVKSRWDVVIDLYRHMKTHYPDLVIMDYQREYLYDETTFLRLAEQVPRPPVS